MSFGEKVKRARLSLDITQKELSNMAGISARTISSYENGHSLAHGNNARRLAEALRVSADYLLSEEEAPKKKSTERDIFLDKVRNVYGNKGVREAEELFDRTSALFAGGTLDEGAKEIFCQSLMEVYLESKEEARAKCSPKKRASRRKKPEGRSKGKGE